MNNLNDCIARITANDRAWFRRHPKEVVRFRPAQTNEFELLKIKGISPPEYRPSWCKPNATIAHVAVIDLTRLLQNEKINTHMDAAFRIRVATIHARTKNIRKHLEKDLIEQICRELLAMHKPSHIPTQPKDACHHSILVA